MSRTGFITAITDQPPPLNVLGERITVLASGNDTGAYEVFRQDGDAGQGPPPHSHDWDETFYVVWGLVEFTVNGVSKLCRAGAVAHVPAGAEHCFVFHTAGQMISVTSRLGASEFFADVHRSVPRGIIDIPQTVAVAARHGLTISPPEPALASAA